MFYVKFLVVVQNNKSDFPQDTITLFFYFLISSPVTCHRGPGTNQFFPFTQLYQYLELFFSFLGELMGTGEGGRGGYCDRPLLGDGWHISGAVMSFRKKSHKSCPRPTTVQRAKNLTTDGGFFPFI